MYLEMKPILFSPIKLSRRGTKMMISYVALKHRIYLFGLRDDLLVYFNRNVFREGQRLSASLD